MSRWPTWRRLGSGKPSDVSRHIGGDSERESPPRKLSRESAEISRVKVVFDPDARDEAREAAVFYEECRPGLGQAFLDALQTGVDEIARRPRTWRRIKGPFRRYLIHRFPFGLIYRLHGNVIYVAAVMHLKRKPGYWIDRAGDPRAD